MSKKLDLEALLDSEARLPADLRKGAAPLLAKLRSQLKKEKDNDTWYRDLGRIQMDFSDLVSDVAKARAEARLPALKKTKRKDLTFEQKVALTDSRYDLQDEILRAKYEKHPNWQRVQRVFDQVRRDVVEEVATLNIPDALKKEIQERVSTMELRMPYADPRKVASYSGCDTTAVQAFYMSDRNAFTVCAGWFNTMQDDASMAFVIAHEITHSFDPGRQVLNRFCGAKGPLYSCDEWAEIRKTRFVHLASIPEPNPAFRKLSSCLKTEEGLKPFENKEVHTALEEQVRKQMASLADGNVFTDLAAPTSHRDGQDFPSEPSGLTTRPRKWRTSRGRSWKTGYLSAERIVQNLCRPSSAG